MCGFRASKSKFLSSGNTLSTDALDTNHTTLLIVMMIMNWCRRAQPTVDDAIPWTDDPRTAESEPVCEPSSSTTLWFRLYFLGCEWVLGLEVILCGIASRVSFRFLPWLSTVVGCTHKMKYTPFVSKLLLVNVLSRPQKGSQTRQLSLKATPKTAPIAEAADKIPAKEIGYHGHKQPPHTVPRKPQARRLPLKAQKNQEPQSEGPCFIGFWQGSTRGRLL